MKNLMKKILAVLTAAGIVLSCGAAFAAEPVFDLSGNPITVPESQTAEDAPEYNGASFPVATVENGGVLTVPLREVAEQLGYTVAWNDETQSVECTRGTITVSLSIGNTDCVRINHGEDGKTVDVSYELQTAPYLYQDSVTYVPAEMLETVLQVSVYTDSEGTIVAEAAEVTANSAVIDEEGPYISVNDPKRGEVIVRISDTTAVTGDLAAIAEGTKLDVEYGVAMTMSLPPQTTAISIAVHSDVDAGQVEPGADETDAVEFSGVVKEQNIEGGQIVIDDNGTERALNIDENTTISHGPDKRIYKIDDLTAGTKITGKRSSAETRSIPPQSYALSIEITD